MKKLPFALMIVISIFAMLAMGCMNREPGPVCPVPTELQSTNATLGGFDGVDMLVVVDNSKSMQEEQEILATAFFPLINSLVNPLPTWDEKSTDNIRVAITTTDMGFSWGGNRYDPDTLPANAATPPDTCADPLGDNGAFVSNYTSLTVNLQNGVIPCDAGADPPPQCPTGWACTNPDEFGVGTCAATGGVGADQKCPPAPETMSANYVTLEGGLYDKEEMAFATACLANVGIEGCGIEQQLIAAKASLSGPGISTNFIRENALLAVLIVSDEEDCSIEDGPGLFTTPEFTDGSLKKVNIACGENDEFLYDAGEIYNFYRQAKAQAAGGTGAAMASNAVLFAAIVGVPPTNVAAGCEGKGSDIGTCLDLPQMKNEQVFRESASNPGEEAWYYEFSCERFVGDTAVTQAYPGIRFVEVAKEFGPMSYVYSICNEDWSPAMEDIAKLIASNITGTCYNKRLDWDPALKEAQCNAVLEFSASFLVDDQCPPGYAWDGPGEVSGEGDLKIVSCKIPKIPLGLNCADTPVAELDRIKAEEFGWYYCENEGENFADACKDGIDNDFNGQVDCEDPQCAQCANCAANGVGDTTVCSDSICRFQVTLTDSALEQAKGATAWVQCLQQFSFEDPNCQENTRKACIDKKDNDGNGPYDCNAVSAEEADADNPAHNADPHCCPMGTPSNGVCNMDPDGDGRDDWRPVCDPDNSRTSYPDSCVDHAKILQCQLPPL